MPGGHATQYEVLEQVLRAYETGSRKPQDEGARPLHYQLSPIGLVTSTNGEVLLTSFARKWIESPDRIGMVEWIHAHLAFFGEVLLELSHKNLRVEEILSLASQKYAMNWKSRDQVRRRVWLLVGAGLVEELGDRYLSLNDSGRAVLDRLPLADPEKINHFEPSQAEEFPEVGPILERRLQGGVKRKSAIGYVTGDPASAFEFVARSASGGVERPELIAQVGSHYRLSKASSTMLIDSVRTNDLIAYTGKETLSLTPLGEEWLADPSDPIFALIAHSTYVNVLEVLLHLDEEERKDAKMVHSQLVWPDKKNPPVQRTTTVLKWLVAAGFARQAGYMNYLATPMGEGLTASLGVMQVEPKSESLALAQVADPDLSRQQRLNDLLDEIRDSSRDSSNPTRFEKAIANAFSYLGVQAQHIGGPGNPDVVVDVRSGWEKIGTAIVDAKSTAGQLSENAVSFDAMKEHAKKVGATRIAVIAPSFGDGTRLIDWAKRHEITLISEKDLREILVEHSEFPLGAHDVWKLLGADSGEDSLERRQFEMQFVGVVRRVVAELMNERSQDAPEPISARDMYRSWRNEPDAPSEEDAQAALEFLASMHIDAVVEEGAGTFVLTELPEVLSGRIHALADAIGQMGAEEV